MRSSRTQRNLSHIHSVVYNHLTENNLLAKDQWGFTAGKSTVTALISTFHEILHMLESGADIALVFFDLQKAFDTVPHLPLLQKLRDHGLNPHILQWITSYLWDRKQFVVVDSASSDTVQEEILAREIFGEIARLKHLANFTLTNDIWMLINSGCVIPYIFCWRFKYWRKI